MAAWPRVILMSVCSSKVMDGPVGNSPGPDSIVNVTGGELRTCRPSLSRTVRMIRQSSVASVPWMVVLSADSLSRAGTPGSGHDGGGILRYSLRYQYQLRLGRR